jgi:SpoVK/Ycf46/Vps4 family AAA+-type ATPase
LIVKVDVKEVHDILFQYDILDQLILYNEDNKSIMLNLVKSCLDGSDTTQRTPLLDRDRNFTGHNGEVVVLLLHGEPGSGKTFTASCIAETVRRPIVTIVPEADENSAQLEKNLMRSFHLAKRWGAIIVMEDSDMFVGKAQDKTAVTLRAIDHYSGVLFLTTNRLSDFDAAVLSRISQHFPYGVLNPGNRQILWTHLLQGAKLEDPLVDLARLIDFVGDQNFSYATRTGRDIQNSFTAAKRLAAQLGQTLDQEHLKTVLGPRQSFVSHFR